ncbi:MAG TPA: hypothetical protein VL326_24485 [Kofleriaceae bacterium]|nr:hypothetical protein [Kofleriaceae bacterium]
MRVVLLSALLLSGCRIDLDHPESADASTSGRDCKVSTASACTMADMHSDFTFVKNTIFPIACSSSPSCHQSATSSGKLDLSVANAYTTLMGPNGTGGVMSNIDKTRVLVVPGQPKQSYLFFMVHGVTAANGDPPFMPPPSSTGLMPMGNKAICCQKIDAIERWITAGAMND